MLICKVFSVLGIDVCWPYAVFATIENISCVFLCLVWPKMQVDRKCHILNKLPQINFTPQMFSSSFSRLQQNTWKWMIFSKNISIKWVIFQITCSNEPNRVLVLFFFSLYLISLCDTVHNTTHVHWSQTSMYIPSSSFFPFNSLSMEK